MSDSINITADELTEKITESLEAAGLSKGVINGLRDLVYLHQDEISKARKRKLQEQLEDAADLVRRELMMSKREDGFRITLEMRGGRAHIVRDRMGTEVVE